VETPRKRPLFKTVAIYGGILLIFVLCTVPAWYFYNKYQAAQSLAADPNALAQKEIDDTIASVGKLVVLPRGETPTVATVTDAEKLKKQAIFASVQNGDKVLIYEKAGKAYIYRPLTGLVVDIVAVNLRSNSDATSSGSVAGAAIEATPTSIPSLSPTPTISGAPAQVSTNSAFLE
jgi:hypothetical protein